jgi:hypothetical protein
MTTHTPMNRARDIWWTLDFASVILFPGVNSRGELVPSHGASRRRLGENTPLDLSFLVNVDMLCTDLLVTTHLVHEIFKRNSIVLSRIRAQY